MPDDQQSVTSHALGVWAQPGIGQAYPELQGLLHRLYAERVAGLSWVPRDWLARVQALQDSQPTSLVRTAPGVGLLAPDFCDSPQKREWWQNFFKMTDAAVAKYAAGQLEAGKAEIEAAYAASAFWNSAYQLAVSIRDLPATIVGSALDGAGSVASGIFSKLFKSWIVWVVIIGALGVAAWRFGFFRKGK
jgi:hypothetical protein